MRGAMRAARQYAGRTASPNAGWPMAAMAGALDVRLTKRAQYVLNGPARTPRPRDIRRCRMIATGAAALAALLVDTL